LNLNLSLKKNHFFSLFIIDSSFNNLKCITLNQLEPNLLLSVFLHLSSLPKLLSLIIDTFNVLKHPTDIYRIVFSLRNLKYFKFSANNANLFISLSIPSDQESSPIQYLIIDHSYKFSELSNIVAYTPELRYIDYMNRNNNE